MTSYQYLLLTMLVTWLIYRNTHRIGFSFYLGLGWPICVTLYPLGCLWVEALFFWYPTEKWILRVCKKNKIKDEGAGDD